MKMNQSRVTHSGSQSDPPQELRYRLADAVNDRLKGFTALHRWLKSWFSRHLQHEDSQPAAGYGNEQSTTTVFPTGAHGTGELPLPPLEMRELVGPITKDLFDNPTGSPVYSYLPLQAYDQVFEFGCGCGRVARQLIQQRPQPRRYLGIDLHRGMVLWCQRNLTPFAGQFEFRHHNVFNRGFNPSGSKIPLPFPAADRDFTLVEALSVFTHLTEQEARFYLQECRRILKPDGTLHASWFLFDKKNFPMMHEFHNALYVQYVDPSSAVIFSREWLCKTARECGFTIVHIVPPAVRGHQWGVVMMPESCGRAEAEFPEDRAPYGVEQVALARRPPHKIGLD